MNIKDILMSGETLFKNEEVFNLDYVPENFVHRDSQIKSIAFCIKPAIRGGRPINARIYGPPATGKTTAIKKIFEEVKDTTNKVVLVHINCQIHTSKFTVFSQIYKKLFGHVPPETGVPFSKVYDSIFKKLIKENKSLVVALDDMNYLFYDRHANEIMYDILRAHEVFPGAKTAIFGIFSDMEIKYRLDPKVGSIFKPQEIFFQPYTYDEIFDILKNRAVHGLYPGVISEDVLKVITEYTSSQGDLRLGIELLRVSAMIAETEARRVIEREDVEKGYGKSKLVNLRQILYSLTEEEKELLKVLSESLEKKINSGELYKNYKKSIDLSYTKFYRILDKLEALRLVDTKFTGRGEKGRTRHIISRYEEDEILKALGMVE